MVKNLKRLIRGTLQIFIIMIIIAIFFEWIVILIETYKEWWIHKYFISDLSVMLIVFVLLSLIYLTLDKYDTKQDVEVLLAKKVKEQQDLSQVKILSATFGYIFTKGLQDDLFMCYKHKDIKTEDRKKVSISQLIYFKNWKLEKGDLIITTSKKLVGKEELDFNISIEDLNEDNWNEKVENAMEEVKNKLMEKVM